MGFSGEDFAFDKDYLPLADVECGITWVLNLAFGRAHCGLQWIEHPHSCEDLSIHVRKNIDRVDNFKLCVATIPEFCEYMGWEIGEVLANMSCDATQLSARQTVREFLSSIAVTNWGCAGMCIELLCAVKGNEESLGLAVQVDKVLSNWIESCQSQERYILLPIVEQTVSDMLTETVQPGTEQIAEMDRLMPLCDTMADEFRIAKAYYKAMKYYYFSLCITNQRFLEHIMKNDFAKLRKAYNNMATTKMRIGRMLTDMGRYGNASRFLAEAIEDALNAGAFYDIAAAYLCRVIMDMKILQKRQHAGTGVFIHIDHLMPIVYIWTCGA